jgi:hypothetical protein
MEQWLRHDEFYPHFAIDDFVLHYIQNYHQLLDRTGQLFSPSTSQKIQLFVSWYCELYETFGIDTSNFLLAYTDDDLTCWAYRTFGIQVKSSCQYHFHYHPTTPPTYDPMPSSAFMPSAANIISLLTNQRLNRPHWHVHASNYNSHDDDDDENPETPDDAHEKYDAIGDPNHNHNHHHDDDNDHNDTISYKIHAEEHIQLMPPSKGEICSDQPDKSNFTIVPLAANLDDTTLVCFNSIAPLDTYPIDAQTYITLFQSEKESSSIINIAIPFFESLLSTRSPTEEHQHTTNLPTMYIDEVAPIIRPSPQQSAIESFLSVGEGTNAYQQFTTHSLINHNVYIHCPQNEITHDTTTSRYPQINDPGHEQGIICIWDPGQRVWDPGKGRSHPSITFMHRRQGSQANPSTTISQFSTMHYIQDQERAHKSILNI